MLNTKISELEGVGRVRAQALLGMEIKMLGDFLRETPRGYKDLSSPMTVGEVKAGMAVCVRGRLTKAAVAHRGSRLTTVTAEVSDETGSLPIVWFNQPYLTQRLKKGQEVLLYGLPQHMRGSLTLVCPSIESLNASGLLPVYKLPKDVPQALFRKLMSQALEAAAHTIEEPLPRWVLDEYRLMGAREALISLHQPDCRETLERAARRRSFEELLMYQLAGLWLRETRPANGTALPVSRELVQPLEKSFPYRLTGAQQRALEEVLDDMRKAVPMARLVQGDVGSGKTAVALLALYACAKCGGQGALLAPTEVLAEQHYLSAKEALEPLGVRVGLLMGGLSPAERREGRKAIQSGEWQVAVGTHALMTPSVRYKNLQLVVADEQHRFGVRQREALREKGEFPHTVVMSATPIPRSLSLVLYGDLDLSVIDEMPPGRTPIKTGRVPEEKRADMYNFLRRQVMDGRQVYVVCPLVEESEALDVASAYEMAESLHKELPNARVGLLHGKLPTAQKTEVAERFRQGAIDVLCATTVIEVGINVPNATVMVIEDADRFGLSQLHQLRGRVGRGAIQSYCFVTGTQTERLKLFCSTNDGFELAQKDLELRGPGDMLGTRQHGLPDHGLLSLAADAKLLDETRRAAQEVVRRAETDRSSNATDYGLILQSVEKMETSPLMRH